MIKPKVKPLNPFFSSGPTKKPKGWSLEKLNTKFLSRYHRSGIVKNYIEETFEKLKQILKIPKNYKIFLTPGSCSGAMESVIWSLLGEKRITSIIYDYWAETWYDDIKKLGYKSEVRKNLNGKMPSLKNIDLESDIFFVWTGTSNGMSVNNTDWISKNHDGLIVTDITSAVFVNDIDWSKLDASVFSWQKALGSEAQHGIVVLSPKAIERLNYNIKKKKIPKVLDLFSSNGVVNTPSLLCLADFNFCLSWFESKGGLDWSLKTCMENKIILDKWIVKNNLFSYFVKENIHRSLTTSFFILNKSVDKNSLKKVIYFLETEKIAYDIQSYRKSPFGIRIWTGPTIIKKDLIALTNWLDWSFYNLEMLK